MQVKILLRIASIIMLVHDFGHTYGHISWKHSADPIKLEVISQMTGHRFPFMGAVHSMAEYYEGYGFAASLALLLIAAILWIISDFKAENAALIKKILVLMSIILLAWGIDELLFFFPFAASFSLAAMLLCIIAVLKINNTNHPTASAT